MLTLQNTLALALASTFVTIQIGALPHPQKAHQHRAVDVTAFTPWEEHPRVKGSTQAQSSINSLNAIPTPVPKKAPQINDDSKAKSQYNERAVNPEGWVPYMHLPSTHVDGKALAERAAHPAIFEDESPKEFEMPLGKRDDYQTVVDENRNEKPVNVVPIVGRTAAAAKQAFGSIASMDSLWSNAKRDDDPITTIEKNRNEKAVHVVPIVGRRSVEKRNLDSDFRINSPWNEMKRDEDAIQIIEENRNEKAVNIVPIVGRTAAVREAIQPSDEKREAVPNPEPISDKLACNGQRYLPSEEKCTPTGLVSLTPSPSPSTPPSTPLSQRSTTSPSQCGSGIGSITYDRSTSYCDPITKQVSPIQPAQGQGQAQAQATNGQQQNIPTVAQSQSASDSGSGSSLARLGQQQQQQQQQPQGLRMKMKMKRDGMSAYGPEGTFPVMEFKQMYEHLETHNHEDSDSEGEEW